MAEGEGVAMTSVSVGLIPCTDLLGFTVPLPPLPLCPMGAGITGVAFGEISSTVLSESVSESSSSL